MRHYRLARSIAIPAFLFGLCAGFSSAAHAEQSRLLAGEENLSSFILSNSDALPVSSGGGISVLYDNGEKDSISVLHGDGQKDSEGFINVGFSPDGIRLWSEIASKFLSQLPDAKAPEDAPAYTTIEIAPSVEGQTGKSATDKKKIKTFTIPLAHQSKHNTFSDTAISQEDFVEGITQSGVPTFPSGSKDGSFVSHLGTSLTIGTARSGYVWAARAFYNDGWNIDVVVQSVNINLERVSKDDPISLPNSKTCATILVVPVDAGAKNHTVRHACGYDLTFTTSQK